MCSPASPTRKLLLVQMKEEEETEIEKHKWFTSEKVGYDVGYEFARIDWDVRYKNMWVLSFMGRHVSKRLRV